MSTTDKVALELTPAEAGEIAGALELLAGLDEGEHTDYPELIRLAGKVRGAALDAEQEGFR